jgi:hypothetical protein
LQNFFDTAEFKLAGLSAFAYAWAYVFESSYAGYYGVSSSVVSISLTDLIRSGLALLFLFGLFFFLADMMPKRGSLLERRKSIALNVLVWGVFLGPIILLELGTLFLFYAPFLFLLLVVSGGFFQDALGWIQTSIRRRRIRTEDDVPRIPTTAKSHEEDLRITGLVFVCAWALLYAAALGQVRARENVTFHSISAAPEVLFIEKYGDFWVGKRVEAGRWGSDTVLMKLPDGKTEMRKVKREHVTSQWAIPRRVEWLRFLDER